ncbi:MAG: peptide synthetase [Gemmatimonadetes bacterium]|nr:MAG: peptide synthetase [Gemmatimonadota bacterium]
MTAVIETGVEASFAELLAGVLRIDQVSVDSHFFDDLGADSLLMAQFCARVRKRGNLPSVSMKDVYAHPTIRSLAGAVTEAMPAPQLPAPTPTRAHEYVLCGALQASFYLGFSYLGVLAAVEGYQLFVGAATGVERVVRLLLFGAVAFLVVAAIPIAAKWLLIGRWKPRQIRLWSLEYFRFWIVKTLIRSNPAPYLFVGSPLYGLYLRALGANIGPGSLILSRRIPICTDLLSIGAGTVIRREASFVGYRAQAGRIEIGPVTLGRGVYVGEMAVLDIDTFMGDGAQLGHSSALLSGQWVPAVERWHGSPAQRTDVNYMRVPPAPPARSSTLRRAVAGTLTLLVILFIYVPLLEGGLDMLSVWVSSRVETGLVIRALAISFVLFFGAVLLGLLALGTIPRLLSGFVKPNTVYPLYGFRYSVYRIIGGLSRMRFFPLLFGDSSYVVHFLRWMGWRLTPVVQTGSNFGSEVTTTNPFLTSVGTGTMTADGLNVFNDDVSSTSFRVSRATIGPRNFVGNYVNYPAGGKTGENCLLGTKVMIPIEGKTYHGVGLLGAPPFEIPRSVERDSQFDHLRTGEALRRGLAAKNRFNLGTISVFLTTRWLGLFLIVLIDLVALQSSHAFTAALLAFSAVAAAIYYALVERCFESLGPPPPPICSIYDSRFWWVERVWKLHPINFLHLFDGTPFKSVLWRLIGVRFGKRVFDDGVFISEPTLTVIGDECALNQQSILQCDSQEDGTYKSGPMTIGAGCTIGVGAFVHYGVTMGDGAVLAADSFLMKGETIPPRTRWGGNPAREL